MKKVYSLDNKLKLYSTLALGVMSAGALNAQIVYHDVNPDVTVDGVSGTASRDSLQIDINADGVDDFQLQVRIYGTTPVNSQANMNAYAVGAETLASLVSYTSLGYAMSIPAGTLIGSASAWNANIQAVMASLFGTTNYGTIGDGADHYLGIKFNDNASALHYGWIRVGGINTNGTTVTIKDWAYQTIADSAIAAGDMGPGAGVTTEPAVESNIFSFNQKVFVNFTAPIQGTVKIYSALGELVYTDRIEGIRKEISVADLSSGIYMIQVETAGQNFTKKVKL